MPDAPVFIKYGANGFIETGLDAWLKSVKAAYVVVMGMETACCRRVDGPGRPGGELERVLPGRRPHRAWLYRALVRADRAHAAGKGEALPKVEFYDTV